LPGLPVKHGENTILRRNSVISNNHKNFGSPSSVVGALPSGSGIIVLAGQKVTIERNLVRDNRTAGLLFVDADYIQDSAAPDKEINPRFEDNKVLDNFFYKNGENPEGKIKLILGVTFLTLKGPDLGAYGKGGRNCYADSLNVRTLGLEKAFAPCKGEQTTASIKTMVDARPRTLASFVSYVPPKDIGRHTYDVVCAGCHASGGIVLIGPSVEELQKKFPNNPKAIAEFAFAPTKIRAKYLSMPSHAYLGREKLMAAAEYILKLKK